MSNKGILYGVGIGPGDPEQLTLKALRTIREADYVACPGKVATETVAYRIVVQAYPELENKNLISIDMPMTKDPVKLEESHQQATKQVEDILDSGKSVAFLTLGDPCIYSTYIYVHQRVLADGYEAAIINGIPSFCAAAARLNIGLVEKAEPLHVLPASYDIQESLSLSGSKVLMKSGKQIGKVKEILLQTEQDILMVENCGMPDEKVYCGADQIPVDAGYYSLIIAKEKSK